MSNQDIGQLLELWGLQAGDHKMQQDSLILRLLQELVAAGRLIVTSDERHDWQKVDSIYVTSQWEFVMVVDQKLPPAQEE